MSKRVLKKMQKLPFILLNVLLLFYLILALSFSGSKEKVILCSEVSINMQDTLKSGFLTKEDVEGVLFSGNRKILGYPIKDINIRDIEAGLKKLAYVKRAEVYTGINGTLYVDVTQRVPLVRILTPSEHSYYMDGEGCLFPARANFTPHVLVASGYFTEGQELRSTGFLSGLSDSQKYSEWFGALEIARLIDSDSLWKSQIVQLYYNRKGDFELIPRVGAHQIILGSAEGAEDKLRKLRVLYSDGFSFEGWNKYEIINLKYKNQVICTKR